jgi:hypothetical protein
MEECMLVGHIWRMEVNKNTVPWLSWLLSGLSPQRLRFDPVLVHVGFVVDKVAL